MRRAAFLIPLLAATGGVNTVLAQTPRGSARSTPTAKGAPLAPPKPESLYGQWEGRVEATPGILPPMLGDREKPAADRGKRLLGATKLFVRLGPKGACKLSSNIVNGPVKSEVARWSLVGSLLKIERPGIKGAPPIVGVVPAPGADGFVSRLTLDLSQIGGRAKGRLILVRTGYLVPIPPSGPPVSVRGRTPA